MLRYAAHTEAYLRSDIDDKLSALALARPEWTPILIVVARSFIVVARSFGVELEVSPNDREAARLVDVTPRREVKMLHKG